MPTTNPENWLCSLVVTEIKLVAWVSIEKILEVADSIEILYQKKLIISC